MSVRPKLWQPGDLFEVPLTGALLETAQAYLDGGAACEPVAPKHAATVMLVRDACPATQNPDLFDELRRVEVFMLRRAKTMAFVPDAVVFPGGSVDVRDSDHRLPWAGPAPSVWAQRMGCDVECARRIVIAAAREVFEESGVLLAGPDAHSVMSQVADRGWEQDRYLLSTHAESFAEMLIRRNLVFRSDLLGVRSHWVTPEFEPRRYDTFFFTALLPAGQIPDGRTTEASGADWVDPLWLFDQAAAGAVLLLPPTRYNLSFIAHAQDAETFVAQTPQIRRIMLEPSYREDGGVVLKCRIP